MDSNPLEKDIEKRVVDFARSLNCYVRKFTSPSQRSVPDRIFITDHGVVFFMELKRLGKVPTPSQELEIAKIRQQGVKVFVVDNVAEGKRVVGEMVSMQSKVFDDAHLNILAQQHLNPFDDPMF